MTYIEGWFVRTLLTTLAQGTALFALKPLVAYRALELGASPAQVGLVAGAYAALSLMFAMPAGRLVDRFGEYPMMLAGTALVTTASISLLWVDNLVTLAFAQSLLGLGSLNLVIGVQTLLGSAGKKGGRDARYGGLAITSSFGQIMGPLVIAVFADTSNGISPRVYFAIIALAATAFTMALSVAIRPPTQHERHGAGAEEEADDGSSADDTRSAAEEGTSSPREASSKRRAPDGGRMLAFRAVLGIKSIPQAMFVSLAVLTSVDVITTYLPVYGESRGIPVTVITTLLAVSAAAALMSRVLMLPMIRILGRQRLLALSVVLPAVALVGLPLTINPIVLGVILAAAGFGLGLGQPMTIGWVASQVPVGIRGTALGLRLQGNTFAQATMPAVIGLLATAIGIGAAFVFASMLLATGGTLLRGVDLDRQSA